MSKPQADERYRAPALDKGLDILELLSEQANGLTRAEIVKAMGRSQSEIYRMLERLVARDYVRRSPEGDRYALSLKMFVLANRHPPIRRLVAQALPLMDVFARETQQSCHLVALDRGAGTVVAQVSSPGNTEFGIRVGAPIDLLHTGSGQTLLAFQNADRRAETLALWAGTPAIEALEELEPTLKIVRDQGYRIGDSQQLVGVRDISVPVRVAADDAIAVFTCPYIGRLDLKDNMDIAATLAMLDEVARTLSFG